MRKETISIMKKIAHLSTAHIRYDTRILVKECAVLSQKGFEVYLLVADGLEVEEQHGVFIKSINKPSGRLKRMTFGVNELFDRAIELDADLYHLHDPELLRIALKLKKANKKVIYDAHEDIEAQVLSKYWIPKAVRSLVGREIKKYTESIVSKLDGLVTATPGIHNTFARKAKNSATVCNYPILKEFDISTTSKIIRPVLPEGQYIAYVGGITETRGMRQLVAAMESFKGELKLCLAGKIKPFSYKEELTAIDGWQNVDYLGFLDRDQVSSLLVGAVAGVVTLHPTKAYVDSLPVKMFEYMAAGIPVIASNFPLWQQIIEEADCGLCVNPFSVTEITEAVRFLIENPARAKEMGINGKHVAFERYNWDNEAEKLVSLYNNTLSN